MGRERTEQAPIPGMPAPKKATSGKATMKAPVTGITSPRRRRWANGERLGWLPPISPVPRSKCEMSSAERTFRKFPKMSSGLGPIAAELHPRDRKGADEPSDDCPEEGASASR